MLRHWACIGVLVARVFVASASAAGSASFLPAEDIQEATPQRVHEHHLQDDIVEINRTRYRLTHINYTLSTDNEDRMRLSGVTEEYPDRDSLIHPYLWTYFLQVIAASIAAGMSLLIPRSLLVLLIAAVVVWPVSWFCKEPIFAMEPGDFMWWMMAIKSVIVNIAPTAPMMYCIIAKPDKSVRQCCGLWVYAILWANVFWTLFFPMPQQVMRVNGCVGASLCCSLIVHLIAMHRGGVTLFDVPSESNILYGYGTSLSWLLCYTVWNALFVADFAVGLTLQDILFWCMMIFYYYQSDQARGVECYFAMARPIQLSMYIAVSDWLGLVPFFRDAQGIGLDVNRHAYILCIAAMNFIYSLYVMYQAMILVCYPDRIPISWTSEEDQRTLLKEME